MAISNKTVEKMMRVLDALISEGKYDAAGNYVLASTYHQAGNTVPTVLYDAGEVLREARAPYLSREPMVTRWRIRKRGPKTQPLYWCAASGVGGWVDNTGVYDSFIVKPMIDGMPDGGVLERYDAHQLTPYDGVR